ncbi:hypothetical protein F8B77_16930 [Aliivibrio finisterrensis]|uniref:Uncharacterized protein n=1 Tax=Aliivibrio finisterrensis TaxID=511998 RepID=A0A6N6RNV1_9GAMM|nr:hypothetical protein F8B77_16930 [Aliivibrio finisterrensis]
MVITNASTRFATFGILGFFEFTVLSGKFELNLHGSKRVMQALCFRDNLRKRDGFHLVGFSFRRGCNILLFRIIFEATG